MPFLAYPLQNPQGVDFESDPTFTSAYMRYTSSLKASKRPNRTHSVFDLNSVEGLEEFDPVGAGWDIEKLQPSKTMLEEFIDDHFDGVRESVDNVIEKATDSLQAVQKMAAKLAGKQKKNIFRPRGKTPSVPSNEVNQSDIQSILPNNEIPQTNANNNEENHNKDSQGVLGVNAGEKEEESLHEATTDVTMDTSFGYQENEDLSQASEGAISDPVTQSALESIPSVNKNDGVDDNNAGDGTDDKQEKTLEKFNEPDKTLAPSLDMTDQIITLPEPDASSRVIEEEVKEDPVEEQEESHDPYDEKLSSSKDSIPSSDSAVDTSQQKDAQDSPSWNDKEVNQRILSNVSPKDMTPNLPFCNPESRCSRTVVFSTRPLVEKEASDAEKALEVKEST